MMMPDSYYPDDIQGWQICYIEGCIGRGHCARCGAINYRLMGYYGAIARWAKEWGISEADVERRFEAKYQKQVEQETLDETI